MENLILYGNGSVACGSFHVLTDDPNYQVVAFTVDRGVIKDNTLCGLPVIPFDEIEARYPPRGHKMLVAVGFSRMNMLRAERYVQAKEKGYALVNYISSRACVPGDLRIGDNCMIGAHTVIQQGVIIGNNVIIRENCIVGHNGIINDHCFLAGGVVIAGNVSIGRNCFLGANCTLKNGIKVSEACLIGAGAVMLNDTQEKEVYMVQPARKLPFPSDRL
jgi:sugar O-acyltransferase (sialic acid O-acetyltransferase NeuD family)